MRAVKILALRPLGGSPGRSGSRWRRNEHFNILRAGHHVSIGNNVAFRVDDHSRADGAAAAHDQVGLPALGFFRGPISGDQDLHHRGRHPLHEVLDGVVQLMQQVWRMREPSRVCAIARWPWRQGRKLRKAADMSTPGIVWRKQ